MAICFPLLIKIDITKKTVPQDILKCTVLIYRLHKIRSKYVSICQPYSRRSANCEQSLLL